MSMMMSMSMMMGMIMVSNMTMICMMIIMTMNVDMIWRTIIHYDKFILPMNAIHHAINAQG